MTRKKFGKPEIISISSVAMISNVNVGLILDKLYSEKYMFNIPFHSYLEAQVLKNPPAALETQVPSLGQEDSLEKEMGMATQSSVSAWRSPWTEEPGRL